MNKQKLWLIIGIVLFLIGTFLNAQYEEHSLTVDATITDIKTEYNSDDAGSYQHTYYGEYTIDGKTYTKRLTTSYTDDSTPKYHKGSTMEIKVYPENPSIKMPEGGLFCVVGFVLAVYNGYILWKNRKQG